MGGGTKEVKLWVIHSLQFLWIVPTNSNYCWWMRFLSIDMSSPLLPAKSAQMMRTVAINRWTNLWGAPPKECPIKVWLQLSLMWFTFPSSPKILLCMHGRSLGIEKMRLSWSWGSYDIQYRIPNISVRHVCHNMILRLLHKFSIIEGVY